VTFSCLGVGIGTARAIALGPAFLLTRGGPIEVPPRRIESTEVEEEIQRLLRAIARAQQELQAVRRQIPATASASIAQFIDTHLLMLEDVTLTETTVHLIRNQLCAAECALQVHRDNLVRVFEEMEDAYLRSRKQDVEHVVNQIQKALLGPESTKDLRRADLRGRILVAQDLLPADVIVLKQRGIAAFVTELGGPMSHTAILARGLDLPAIVGVHHITRYLRDGETLVVDCLNGVVLAEATPAILGFYRERIRAYEARRAALKKILHRPSVSLDGVGIDLLANIEIPDDIATARGNGAAGVGLYRTEFLYMNRDSLPDEEEQLDAYRRVVEGMGAIPVTIRTLDLGVDKQAEGHPLPCPAPCNPALGLRAIRLCLREPELFRPQLRAILRASALGPVRLMIPMLSSLQELASVLRLIEETKQALQSEGLAFDPDIPVGGMIEVPAAALAAGSFARRLDFLSIGTNDLIQYTLAIDRVDEAVTYLYDPLHPAILRLIRMVIEAGQRQGIPVGMCGEMAGDPRFTRLLLGMGLREFSMQPRALLEVKAVIRESNVAKLAQDIEELLAGLDGFDAESLAQRVDALNPKRLH